MQDKNQNPSQQDDQANYNPTGRNFDQSDVSGRPESINNVREDAPIREEETVEDNDPPLTEQDLEETGLSDEEADQVEWDEPEDNERGANRQGGSMNAPE